MHYARWFVHGDPEKVTKAYKYNGAKCKISECDRVAEDTGMCGRHAWRWRKHGDPLYVTPEKERIKRLRESLIASRPAKRSSYLKFYGRHEHRVVAENMLGRKLRRGEIVHHKDHDKHNNHPSNLQVMTQSEHIRAHFDKSKKLPTRHS